MKESSGREIFNPRFNLLSWAAWTAGLIGEMREWTIQYQDNLGDRDVWESREVEVAAAADEIVDNPNPEAEEESRRMWRLCLGWRIHYDNDFHPEWDLSHVVAMLDKHQTETRHKW